MIEKKKKIKLSPNKLMPPKRNLSDAAHAIVSGLVGSIPVAGSASAELFKWLVTPSLEKRKDDWMKSVA